ncbi:nitrous oxide reductase accessory protein NosL [Mesoterricola sediminis]|uniref:NosL family protein n=1 Tax=Mesoterricola sediminis TaxID=2927980 RepID=A0AA48HFK8_9BACT|nr:nitrous oxide reductase accessory protein NosL [Mesoterricola sediminis]BDU77328.1 NosL family protein [Mesoterricola sediminis]
MRSLAILALLALPLTAQTPSAPPAAAAPADDLARHPRCGFCGMDRTRFSATRMLVVYADGHTEGTCSLHCAALGLALNLDREPARLWVGDQGAGTDPRPLLDAEQATFLLGSRLPGVMTAVSKAAFASRDAALRAQAAQGGELATFEQALQAAYADMAKDVARIRKMRAERKRHAQPAAKP